MLFDAARNADKAAAYFQLGAQYALSLSAATEAVTLGKQALRALETLPDDEDRRRRELTITLTLARALVASGGYASLQVGQACDRALTLCEQLGATPLLVPALIGLWQVHISRGSLVKARSLAQLMLETGTRADNRLELHNANVALGITAVCRGELSDGRRLLAAALELPPGFDRLQGPRLRTGLGLGVPACGTPSGSAFQWISSRQRRPRTPRSPGLENCSTPTALPTRCR